MTWKIIIPVEPPRKQTEEERLKMITDWIAAHNAYDMPPKEVAKSIMREAIENTKFAEDVYTGLKKYLLESLDNE